MTHPSTAVRSGEPRQRLIVALDLSDPVAARALAAALASDVAWFKVGLELFASAGPQIVTQLRGDGARIFLDLKLHDIPNTVAQATRAAARLGAELCTVHALSGAAVEAAVAAAGAAGDLNARAAGEPLASTSMAPGSVRAGSLAILAVTILTSHADGELARLCGSTDTTAGLALRLAQSALAQGAAGLVCSPLEVAALRAAIGTDPLLVVPGVRPADASRHDQARVATPAAALRAGADLLVVGRPITRAAVPRDAARRILDEMSAAV